VKVISIDPFAIPLWVHDLCTYYHIYLVKRFTLILASTYILSLDLRLSILGNRILSKYIVFLRLAMTDYDQMVENIRKHQYSIQMKNVFFFHNKRMARAVDLRYLGIVFDLSP
jgi:hypothetical protein